MVRFALRAALVSRSRPNGADPVPGAMTDLPLKARINLGRAVVLLLDDSAESLAVMVQIVTAFGVKHFHKCASISEAKEIADHAEVDLVLAATHLRHGSGYDFIEWLRRSKGPNAFAPAILLSGHVRLTHVKSARDCGANFIVSKPLSPAVLLERIVWVARESRPFVSCDSYFGPDRRFRTAEDAPRRRHDDVEPEAAEADPAIESRGAG